jgi:hypothetical protein
MDIFQLVTVIPVVHWMMEHVIHVQTWQMVWSQVAVTAKRMLMAVVVIGARMDSGILMDKILKVVNVRINSSIIVNCKMMLQALKMLYTGSFMYI